MNIAASNLAPQSAPTRSDGSQATSGTSPSDVDADDAVTDGPHGFGAILSKSIAPGAPDGKSDKVATGLDPADPLRGAGKGAPVEPTTLPSSIGLPSIAAVATSTTGDAAKSDATKNDRASADDSSDSEGGAIGSDLAAQLALVSQWTGLTPRTDATAAGKTSTDTLDVQGKLDAVRGGAGRIARDAVAAAGIDATTSASEAGTLLPGSPQAGLDRNALAATRASANDRPTRSVVAALSSVSASTASGITASTAVAATPIDAKILDLARAIAPDAQSATVSPLIADIAGRAPASDPTTVGSFLAQIASQLASQAPSQIATADTSPAVAAPTDTLREQVGTPAWSHEVGQAALRMAANDLQNVSLRLNPEHLGPLDVQMRVDNGVAHLQFAAAHIETRQALESSRTTLDQMFGDQGIKLGDWSVGQQSSNASNARDFGTAASAGGGRDGRTSDDTDASGTTITTATVRTNRPLGLVDTFA